MKFDLVSDLHLDFFDRMGIADDIEKPFYEWFDGSESDTLLIAGDIENCLGSGKNELADRFFDFVAKRYDNVIAVLGNHDYWNNFPYYDSDRFNFETMVESARTRYGSVRFLNASETIDLGNFVVIGATMWTDVPTVDRPAIQHHMNDYVMTIHSDGTLLNVNDTSDESVRVRNFLSETVSKNPDRDFVILTHHVPYPCYVSSRFSKVSGYAYANNLEGFIRDNPNIRLWVFGHTHDPVDAECGSCRLVCNPHGYVKYEKNPKDYRVKTIEI